MLVRLQNTILEMIAKGQPLALTTDRLCIEVERLVPDILCSVLSVDANGLLHPLSGPSLPEIYSSALEGVAIGPAVGSCGTAAFRGTAVAVADIETDPLWKDFRALALPLGLVACWSSPICNGQGTVIGTFAFYYRKKRGPSRLEKRIVNTCVNLCAIALERNSSVLEDRRLAYSDALTGLANRAKFNATIPVLPCTAPGAWGLLIVDIDNLKIVNDTFGHRAGDDLIRSVASRIASIVPPDRAFRLGGDEFAVIVQQSDRAGDIDAVASKILEALNDPSACAGHAIVPSATIGGAVLEANECSPEVVRQNADFALYHAKETGRGHFVRYTHGLGTTIMRRFRAVSEVSAALGEDRIDAYYQPIVLLETKEIVGVEALCRLRTTSGEIIPAAEFCEATSDVHVASRLTQRMLSRVAADVRMWLDLGIPFQHVAVNVSSADFHHGKLGEQITKTFERANVSLEHVILEVTESVYMGRRDHVIAREIQALRSKGLRVALDDFGTGYASLTHLLTVPVDIIKIDKSFVDRLAPGNSSFAIVEGLVSIARKLGIRVIAEGVETAVQAELLSGLGCRLAQGYFYAKAVDREAATDLLIRLAQTPAAALRSLATQLPAFPFIGAEPILGLGPAKTAGGHQEAA